MDVGQFLPRRFRERLQKADVRRRVPVPVRRKVSGYVQGNFPGERRDSLDHFLEVVFRVADAQHDEVGQFDVHARAYSDRKSVV